jgi:hypothetical protein
MLPTWMRRRTLGQLVCCSLLAVPVACNWAIAEPATKAPRPAARPAVAPPTTRPDFQVDTRKTLEYLASEELEGRLIGTPGIDKAADRIAETFDKLGLQGPKGWDGYFQPFELTTRVELDPKTTLDAGKGNKWVASLDAKPKLREDYQPLGVSGEGEFSGEVVFAGYAIASKENKYDDFAGLDVKDKVVLALRFEPHDDDGKSRFVAPKSSGPYSDQATFFAKAKAAADRGAVALLVVNPPAHNRGDVMVPFTSGSPGERTAIPVVQVKQEVAEAMLKVGGAPDLRTLQNKIDEAVAPQSVALKDVSARGAVAFKRTKKQVKNVAAVVPGSGEKAGEYVVIGAHYDHLGKGASGSFAPFSNKIHYGADDNASGTTAMLKLAEHFAHAAKGGKPPARTLVFVAFTAEETGLLGSKHFVNNSPIPMDKIVAMLNLDMVGRVRDNKLSIGGVGTAPSFEKILHKADEVSPLTLSTMSKGGLGPSDHTSFAMKKVPVIFFFSGLHIDYHRPTDVASKVNFEGIDEVVKLGIDVVEGMTEMPREQYVSTFDSSGMSAHGDAASGSPGGARATLGVIPNYSEEEGPNQPKGVRISGTGPGSPAETAGLKDGDLIVQLGETKIDNLMDLTDALRKGKPGEKVKLVYFRGEKKVETETTLAERKS